MADELELKAVVPDAEALRASLAAANASCVFTGRMEDRRYDREGVLTARDEVLRVRTMRPRDGRVEWHLGWKGPTRRSPEGYKLREERECTVTGSTSPEGVLLALGYMVVHAIDRAAEIWSLDGATIRLETYPEMDMLLEVEGDAAGIERAIVATGLPREAFTPESLAAFVSRYEARTGRPARLARGGGRSA